MPQTIIKIKTWTCSCCKSQRDSNPFDPEVEIGHEDVPEGLCHYCYKNILKNNCKNTQECRWEAETDTDRLITMTVQAEEYFDDTSLIRHDGSLKLTEHADHHDKCHLEIHLDRLNRQKGMDALSKGKVHEFKFLTENDDHGWVAPKREKLSKKEREEYKARVRADIAKFRKLEHKK